MGEQTEMNDSNSLTSPFNYERNLGAVKYDYTLELAARKANEEEDLPLHAALAEFGYNDSQAVKLKEKGRKFFKLGLIFNAVAAFGSMLVSSLVPQLNNVPFVQSLISVSVPALILLSGGINTWARYNNCDAEAIDKRVQAERLKDQIRSYVGAVTPYDIEDPLERKTAFGFSVLGMISYENQEWKTRVTENLQQLRKEKEKDSPAPKV